MKKLFLLLSLFCAVNGFAAPETESRMFVASGRETFFNFPSDILGSVYALSVYLPEDAVPLRGRYPVVYFVGLDREAKEAYGRFAQENKVLLVGIGLTEKELEQKTVQTGAFITQELIPYIDTNYSTFASPDKRLVAAQGKMAGRAALEVFNQGHSVHNLALQDTQGVVENIRLPESKTRILVRGTQGELANAAQLLSAQQVPYGSGFFLQESTVENTPLSVLPLTYFFAPQADVLLEKVTARVGVKTLPLAPGTSVSLRLDTQLKNGLTGVFVPPSVRVSPPFLNWNSTLGSLSVINGAESGRVNISGSVDSVEFSTQIMLKKQ